MSGPNESCWVYVTISVRPVIVTTCISGVGGGVSGAIGTGS